MRNDIHLVALHSVPRTACRVRDSCRQPRSGWVVNGYSPTKARPEGFEPPTNRVRQEGSGGFAKGRFVGERTVVNTPVQPRIPQG
jgi:hypothetical protein